MHPRTEGWIPKEKEDVTDISPREGGRAVASDSNQQLTSSIAHQPPVDQKKSSARFESAHEEWENLWIYCEEMKR